MKILITYDSAYGNTELVAKKIADSLCSSNEVRCIKVVDVNEKSMEDMELMFVGSPTQGGRATKAMQDFLSSIPDHGLNNIKVAVFDTRFSEEKQNFALRLLMKTIGYAGEKIAEAVEKKGGKVILPVAGFIVDDKKGPLAEGELNRAVDWAWKIIKQ